MKKITFITTAQPTTNPRLVKEAEYAKSLGYDVKVMVCFYEKWAEKFDAAILSKNPGMYVFCGGSPNGNLIEKLIYYKTRLRQRICLTLFKVTRGKRIAEIAISRAHPEALNASKRTDADLFIAHNLGALPAAVMAAKYCKAKVGYDAEDMDSGQYLSKTDFMYLLNLGIEQKYFPETDYFTAASPLIAAKYKELYSFLDPVIINNVFPKISLTNEPSIITPPLKLFWFSQTVGIQRGIEDVIKAMAIVKKPVELHLLGDYDNKTQSDFLQIALVEGLKENQVNFHRPIAAEVIFEFASQFDIGMATEIGIPLNRDICLTNKIFTYLQCGLAIIASNTQAQSHFFEQYPSCGKIYNKNEVSSLAEAINAYQEQPSELSKTKNYNYQLGQTEVNWDSEKFKFSVLIQATLNNNKCI